MMSYSLDFFGSTDKGQVRLRNEDNFFISGDLSVFAVADGLGGLPEGALASEIVVQYLEETLTQAPLELPSLFTKLNDLVYEHGLTLPSEMGMGTTLTLLQFLGEKVQIGQMGDSIAVRIRDGDLCKLTKDHTMAQDILDKLKEGQPAPKIPDYFYHALTRCLGQRECAKTDIISSDVKPGDKFLLFTDGLSNVVDDLEILALAQEANSLESLVKDLISRANALGGPDNITVVAISVA